MKKKIIITTSIIITLISSILIFNYSKEYIKKNKEPKEELEYMPITYEICDKNSCINLLGSIHIGDERITKFNKKLIELYNKSKYLAVELDIQNTNMDLETFIAKPNETIEEIIPEDLKIKLSTFLENKGLLKYEQLKYFKIGYISNYLSLLPSMELNLINSGVDEYFLTLAHNEEKPIIELETYEEQMSLLLDYSNEFFINQINETIDNYEEGKKELKLLYEEYLKANKTKLEELLKEEENFNTEEERDYQNKLLYDRNQKMAIKIEEFLEKDEDVFMIVGLAHVIGEKGIIDLLEEKDYKIRIIEQ